MASPPTTRDLSSPPATSPPSPPASIGFGLSEGRADGMLEMLLAKESGLDNGVARTPRHAIDTPTTFRQWCEDILEPAVRAA
ncbi:hypothetical protein [Amycolatopsis acidiphila]|uniref:hypothetical protein n=1 Tax=Amycolatopsis acidiphila TaxID=715473 RepID=UPI0019BB8C86|nr:hypothetical protein [Amycolatopsis acidiphila]GHG74053.1 hypothetical protein GCM10017788_37600 [Amycolatopsis acidiphila]